MFLLLRKISFDLSDCIVRLYRQKHIMILCGKPIQDILLGKDEYDMQENRSGITQVPDMRLGYAYVLPQMFENLYATEEALKQGTLFRDLNIPMEVYGPIGN